MNSPEPRAMVRRAAFAALLGIAPVQADLLPTGGSLGSGHYDYEDHYRPDQRRHGNVGNPDRGHLDGRGGARYDNYRRDRRNGSSVGSAGLAEQRRIQDANRGRDGYGDGRDRNHTYGHGSGHGRRLYDDDYGRDRSRSYGYGSRSGSRLYDGNSGRRGAGSYGYGSRNGGRLYGDDSGHSHGYSTTPRNKPGYHSGGSHGNYGQQSHGYSGRQRAPSVPQPLRRYRNR